MKKAKSSVLLSNPALGHHIVPYIDMPKFGKDHWSTFGYAECRIVDHQGIPDRRHMRCNARRHPQFAHVPWSERYATRIANNAIVPHHDDWDCVEDLVRVGLLEDIGTGVNPCWKLTDAGKKVAAELRQWKGDGGTFATFKPSGVE